MLRVFLRKNYSQYSRSPFCFRSLNEAVFTYDRLIDEMAKHNTTLTRADLKGAMDVLREVVQKYLLLGYIVKTPFGSLYVSASGTAGDKETTFTPRLHKDEICDHELKVRYTPDQALLKEVVEMLFDHTSNRLKMLPYIDQVTSCLESKRGSDAILSPGEPVHVYGDYLKLNSSDENQGVFLQQNDGSRIRVTEYMRTLPRCIEFMMPKVIPGTYTLVVRAKPANHVWEAVYEDPVEVTE